MRIVMKRSNVMTAISGVHPDDVPTFQIRHEFFRLARGSDSIRTIEGDRGYVELELERVLVVDPASVIVLRGSQVEKEPTLFVNGSPVR